jgi:hypothetical protein
MEERLMTIRARGKAKSKDEINKAKVTRENDTSQMKIPLEETFKFINDGCLIILNDIVLDKSAMYQFSVEIVPKIIKQLLDHSGIRYQHETSNDSEIFSVNRSDKEKFEEIIKQCIEYRCSNISNTGHCEILRQLPMHVAIIESNKLVTLGKKHAIYKSIGGKYNIKVKDYKNDSLGVYSRCNSKTLH